MRITITGNPDNQTLLVMASVHGKVIYCTEHEPEESIGEVMRKVRAMVGTPVE